jgi:uncharacterized protein YcbK (DUF882 family)
MQYFTYQEFDSPDEPGSGKNMRADFLDLLDHAREEAGIPFKVSSGYRTQKHNQDLRDRGYKASMNSSHMKGCAADIVCINSANRSIIVRALVNVGFTRLGIAKSFIHVDNDSSKPDSIWLY